MAEAIQGLSAAGATATAITAGSPRAKAGHLRPVARNTTATTATATTTSTSGW